jgi:hypothetical protein
MIFVNSMSDLFHKEIPRAYIAAVFDTMEKACSHTYQVLTKRSSLMQKFLNERYIDRPAPAHITVFGVTNRGRRWPMLNRRKVICFRPGTLLSKTRSAWEKR